MQGSMARMHIPGRTFKHVASAEQAGGESTWSLNCFTQLNCLVFSGTTNPLEVNRWIVYVKILIVFECLENHQVTFVTVLLFP
jgi:hypothetical protein